MKLIRIAKDLYDYFTPLTFDDQHAGLSSSDQANGWGKWSRVRIVGGLPKVIRGASLDDGSKNWLNKKLNRK